MEVCEAEGASPVQQMRQVQLQEELEVSGQEGAAARTENVGLSSAGEIKKERNKEQICEDGAGTSCRREGEVTEVDAHVGSGVDCRVCVGGGPL